MSRILPILFNTEMIQAILDGRKTCTRRIAKKVPKETYRIEEETQNGNLMFNVFGAAVCQMFRDLWMVIRI